ncbi:hypothetical protein PSU4_28410 [Pseudonocardia sulfidoxydans NBRC 16205]|uniref:Uncharacterized protein n=1 Tax=Pseudonocardia sulfidoxydans NBRC 16205 TaxID=1223511 RepID=A0A511DH99_9PSEU|nr:hypothetical protein PSU4_28410 [Pseudonocardia sulfidoxydans NBRC 16205]
MKIHVTNRHRTTAMIEMPAWSFRVLCPSWLFTAQPGPPTASRPVRVVVVPSVTGVGVGSAAFDVDIGQGTHDPGP